MSPRIDEARQVVRSLLDDLEGGPSPPKIDAILMKAARLARLMRDSDARLWLDFEARGYPTNFSFSALGVTFKRVKHGIK
jgi:AbiTii